MHTRQAYAAALTLTAAPATAAPATATTAVVAASSDCNGAGKVCWQSHGGHPYLAVCKDLQWTQIKNNRDYFPGHRVTATGCHPARDGYDFTVTVWR